MAANAGVMLIRASLKDIRPRSPSEGTQVEARQNIFAADAAKAAGVHLVFTALHDFESWAKAQDWNTLLQAA